MDWCNTFIFETIAVIDLSIISLFMNRTHTHLDSSTWPDSERGFHFLPFDFSLGWSLSWQPFLLTWNYLNSRTEFTCSSSSHTLFPLYLLINLQYLFPNVSTDKGKLVAMSDRVCVCAYIMCIQIYKTYVCTSYRFLCTCNSVVICFVFTHRCPLVLRLTRDLSVLFCFPIMSPPYSPFSPSRLWYWSAPSR